MAVPAAPASAFDDRLAIIDGDITKQAVDAIVNAANPSLLGGGGVDGAIHLAAGPELLAECRTLGRCGTGDAKITKGHKLPARFIIHTVGPVWQPWSGLTWLTRLAGVRTADDVLARCYRSCFALAEPHDVRTIAFPSISTGVYGFPINRAARIALTEIQAFLRRNGSVERVVVVCFDQQAFDAYTAALPAIVGHNTDPAFVGIAAIKKKQSKQLTLFEQWARQERWVMFHSEHYDWWMFPIDEESSYGRAWTVYESDIAELKKDAEYIQNYLNGARLLARSWGWNLEQQSLVANPKPAQRWQRWPIRLYKAAKSLKLFGFAAEFESMKKFANDLLTKGEDLTYNLRDLSVLFK